MLIADVSEPSISSIVLGRRMKYDRGWDLLVYLYLTGFWQAGGGAKGRRVTRCEQVGAQQVVEGGRYISASVGEIAIV